MSFSFFLFLFSPSLLLGDYFQCLLLTWGRSFSAAMTKLYHFEFLELMRAQRWNDVEGGFEADMLSNQNDLRVAAFRVVVCLKDLAQHRLLRWLPSNLYVFLSSSLLSTSTSSALFYFDSV